jgi:hypothetical protein
MTVERRDRVHAGGVVVDVHMTHHLRGVGRRGRRGRWDGGREWGDRRHESEQRSTKPLLCQKSRSYFSLFVLGGFGQALS